MAYLDNKIIELVCLLFIYIFAFLELRRGWNILFRNKVVYFTGAPLLIRFLKFLEFDELSRKIEYNLSEEKNQKASGIIGLIIGILLSVSSIISSIHIMVLFLSN